MIFLLLIIYSRKYFSTYLYINLFTYLLISLLIHHFFSSSRINQCYQLLRYIYFFILYFIDYQLFLFVFKLLGNTFIKSKAQMAT